MKIFRLLTAVFLIVVACTSTVRNSSAPSTKPSNAQAVAVCDARPIEQRAHCMKMLEIEILKSRIAAGEQGLESKLARAEQELVALEQQLLQAAGANTQATGRSETPQPKIQTEEESKPVVSTPAQSANAKLAPEPVVYLPRIVKHTPTTGLSTVDFSGVFNSQVKIYGLERAANSHLNGKPEKVRIVVLVNGFATCPFEGQFEPILVDVNKDSVADPARFDGPCPIANNGRASPFYFAVNPIIPGYVFVNADPEDHVTLLHLVWNGQVDRGYVPEQRVWEILKSHTYNQSSSSLAGNTTLPAR